MKRATFIPVIMILASSILAGCATIFGGARYNAHVVVNNKPDAKIVYKGETKGVGTATFLVKRKEADKFSLNIGGEGLPEQRYDFDSKKFRGWALAGGSTGIIIDFVTGAFWKPDVKNNDVIKENYDNFKYVVEYRTDLPAKTEAIATIRDPDVDMNIPVNPQNNDKTFVVIIANENYSREEKVQYASNDGKVFKDYCEKTLGIPPSNIHFTQDATFGTMRSEIRWLSEVMAAYKGEAKVIFYYAGHGMPDETDRSAYLLPADGFSTDFETAIKLDDLYRRLTMNPSRNVTVFLDACFSGSIRDNGMLANARSVKIKPKANFISGNMVVFSAATGDETAYSYEEKQHGLFTYFLLKKLQESRGEVNYQDLADFIAENVKHRSVVVNQKSQSPQVMASYELEPGWQTLTLK